MELHPNFKPEAAKVTQELPGDLGGAVYNDSFFDIDPTVPKLRIDQVPKSSKWAFEALYNYDKNGNTRLWQVGFDGESIITRSGLPRTGNYVIATSRVEMNASGRDIPTQALLEARSRYNDKYVGDTYRPVGHQPATDIQPALAETYPKKKIKSFPVAVSAKLDGERMRVIPQGKTSPDGSIAFKKLTRSNRNLDHVTHIDPEIRILLANLPPGTILDGEMYAIGIQLNRIRSMLGKVGNPDVVKLTYHVFDIYLPNVPFQDRYNSLCRAFEELYKLPEPPGGSKVCLVNSFLANSDAELKLFRDKYVELGYEGLIIRKIGQGAETFYEQGRSTNLLKFKVFLDEEARIVEVYESSGTEAGLAMFLLEDTRGKRFGVRPSGSFEERRKWFLDPKKVLGRMYTFKHVGRSEYDIPRQPVGVGFRDEI